MFSLISQIIFLASLGLIIFLAARHWPKSGEWPEREREDRFAGKLLKKIPLEKVDSRFNLALEKLLRKIRIAIIKIDGYLLHWLETLKRQNQPKNIFGAENGSNENKDNEENGILEILEDEKIFSEELSDNENIEKKDNVIDLKELNKAKNKKNVKRRPKIKNEVIEAKESEEKKNTEAFEIFEEKVENKEAEKTG